ncbi:ribose-phosphate diphosphokinase [Candidatus Micrarchaeota archaeon]|nr:ribose-phosphate diphosphokinase [Candidatus Micrarchaeota archaeon]
MRLVSPNFSDVFPPNIEIKTFPDGDSYIRVPELGKCSGKEVTLLHRLYPNQNESLIQAVLILSALKKAKCKVRMVAPDLPYSICNLLFKAGVDEHLTFDCHFLKKEGNAKFGGLKIKNLSLSKALVEKAREKFGEDFITISPDQGASYMTSGGMSMKKTRGEYESGKDAYRKIENLSMDFSVSGKNILIIDDMVSTGGTMVKAVENIKKAGAKKVGCAATHGFFLRDSMEKLSSITDFVFVSNSIPCKLAEINIAEWIE